MGTFVILVGIVVLALLLYDLTRSVHLLRTSMEFELHDIKHQFSVALNHLARIESQTK
jgi:predicted Holliday junction resolvase-like endonuclease